MGRIKIQVMTGEVCANCGKKLIASVDQVEQLCSECAETAEV